MTFNKETIPFVIIWVFAFALIVAVERDFWTAVAFLAFGLLTFLVGVVLVVLVGTAPDEPVWPLRTADATTGHVVWDSNGEGGWPPDGQLENGDEFIDIGGQRWLRHEDDWVLYG